MKLTSILLLCLFPSLASADAYLCVVDGRTTYTQFPCREVTQRIDVDQTIKPTPKDSKQAVATHQVFPTAPLAPQVLRQQQRQSMQQSQRLIRDSQIRSKTAEIRRYQRQRDMELSNLRQQKRYLSNNPANDVRENQISNKMRAVTDRYRSRIGTARWELSRIRGGY